MAFPLIGKRSNQPQKLKDLQEEEYKKYQGEMMKKLVDWEIEHDCIVQSILVTPKTNNSLSFMAVTEFIKMSNEQKNDLKRKLIEADNLIRQKVKDKV